MFRVNKLSLSVELEDVLHPGGGTVLELLLIDDTLVRELARLLVDVEPKWDKYFLDNF